MLFIVALVIAIPVIMFPAAFVWYMNISGIYQVLKDKKVREKRRHEGLGTAKI